MDSLKKEIQEWVDRQYDNWLHVYSPQRHEGEDVFDEFEDTSDENLWTVTNEFVQDFYTTSDGRELPFVSVDIIPGIQEVSDTDMLFVSPVSWLEEGDEYTGVRLEVVVTCQNCLRSGSACAVCEGSGEWTFVATSWNK